MHQNGSVENGVIVALINSNKDFLKTEEEQKNKTWGLQAKYCRIICGKN